MSEIKIPSAAARIVTAEVAAWGGRGAETGGFLLCRQDEKRVEKVALTGARGIRRAPDQFVLSGRALSMLFTYAEECELSIWAQFHSHGRAAFLSHTDLTHGFSVEGFVTTVIPYFAAPPEHPKEWGWWIYEKEWRETKAPRLADGPTGLIRFDEEGVREG